MFILLTERIKYKIQNGLKILEALMSSLSSFNTICFIIAYIHCNTIIQNFQQRTILCPDEPCPLRKAIFPKGKSQVLEIILIFV